MTKTVLPPLPEVDDVTRREFLVGAAGLLLFPAGCGSNGGGEEPASGDTRTIEHAFGEVEVPVKPERVVVLNTIAFDSLVALGMTPVASVENTVSVHEDQMNEVEVVLDALEPSLERIATLDPDILLHAAFEGELFSAGTYEQFSEIAPTAVYAFESDGKWKEYFLFFANALNVADEAEEALEKYEARVESLRTELGDAVGETSVAALQVTTENIRNFRADSFFAGSILDEIGFAGTPDVPGDFSLELLPDVEADYVFVHTFGGSEEEDRALADALEEVTSSPLWERVPAVQNGQAHIVGDYWFGFGLTAANAVLDDIERFLLEGRG
jgi:iron complex transport system substrate-binding protein